jgi:hypothetical protein
MSYAKSINSGPICRGAAVYVQNADHIEFELRIMEQAKKKCMTGSHIDDNQRWLNEYES